MLDYDAAYFATAGLRRYITPNAPFFVLLSAHNHATYDIGHLGRASRVAFPDQSSNHTRDRRTNHCTGTLWRLCPPMRAAHTSWRSPHLLCKVEHRISLQMQFLDYFLGTKALRTRRLEGNFNTRYLAPLQKLLRALIRSSECLYPVRSTRYTLKGNLTSPKFIVYCFELEHRVELSPQLWRILERPHRGTSNYLEDHTIVTTRV
jgi:hypothetical protein